MYVNFYDPLDNKLSIQRLLSSIHDAISINRILNKYQEAAMYLSSFTTTRNKYAANSVLLPSFRPPLFFGFLFPSRFKWNSHLQNVITVLFSTQLYLSSFLCAHRMYHSKSHNLILILFQRDTSFSSISLAAKIQS